MSKKILVSMLLAAFAATTQAETSSSSSTNSAAGTAAADNAGNSQSIVLSTPGNQVIDTNTSGTQTIKNVPSVNGPNLTTSNDTCMGSTSGSLNIAGIGVGGGSTWTDTNCVMLKNSRELWNMGMKAAALALLCNDQNNRAALEVTGYQCPVAHPAAGSPDLPSDRIHAITGH